VKKTKESSFLEKVWKDRLGWFFKSPGNIPPADDAREGFGG